MFPNKDNTDERTIKDFCIYCNKYVVWKNGMCKNGHIQPKQENTKSDKRR